MKEYKIIEGTPVECQKLLNQWKHEFHVDILKAVGLSKPSGASQIAIILTREKK